MNPSIPTGNSASSINPMPSHRTFLILAFVCSTEQMYFFGSSFFSSCPCSPVSLLSFFSGGFSVALTMAAAIGSDSTSISFRMSILSSGIWIYPYAVAVVKVWYADSPTMLNTALGFFNAFFCISPNSPIVRYFIAVSYKLSLMKIHSPFFAFPGERMSILYLTVVLSTTSPALLVLS